MDKKTKLLCLASLFVVTFMVTHYKSREETINRKYESVDHTINRVPYTAIDQVIKDEIVRTELVNTTVPPHGENELYNDSDRKKSENYSCEPVVPRLSTKSLPITGLVSFPGAGNTWVRHLLQQVSGIGTSSVYCDKRLTGEFPLECQRQHDKVIAVKLHFHHLGNWTSFDRIILLIRNPYRNILAFFNFRKSDTHTGVAKPKHFLGRDWAEFVHAKTEQWKNETIEWIRHYTKPLHIVFHENLKTDLQSELRKIFEFLDIPVNETALACIEKSKEGRFRRKNAILGEDGQLLTLNDLYTDDMIEKITEASNELSSSLKSRFGIEWTYSFPTF